MAGKLTKEDIWEMSDALTKGPLPVDVVEETVEVLKNHAIELYSRPSARPGVEPDVIIDHDGTEREVWYKGASPAQIDFQAAFFRRKGHERTSPTYYCIAGGNRAGKSIVVWAMCFCLDIRDYAKNGDVFWAIAPTERKLIDDVQEWVWTYLPRFMFGDRVFNKENGFGQNRTLELILPDNRGTCKLLFKTEEQMVTNPGTFEASSVNGIAWTEARYEPLVSALRTRIIDTRGYILVDYLPCEGWHQNRFAHNPQVHHATFGMLQNQHNLPPGEIEKFRQENAHDPDMLALRIDGKPRAMMGVVITTFDRERHCVDPFVIPHDWPLYISGDWGFDHNHAFSLAAVAPDETIYIIDEEYRNRMSVEETVRALWRMTNRWRPMDHGNYASSDAMYDKLRKLMTTRRIDVQEGFYQYFVDPELDLAEWIRDQWEKTLASPIVIDSQIFQQRGDNGNKTLASQFMEIGTPIRKAVKGEIEWSVELLRKRFFDNKMFLFRNCVWHRRDLSSWKYKKNPHGETTGAVDRYEEQYKDGCDDLRYLLQINPKHAPYMDAVA